MSDYPPKKPPRAVRDYDVVLDVLTAICGTCGLRCEYDSNSPTMQEFVDLHARAQRHRVSFDCRMVGNDNEPIGSLINISFEALNRDRETAEG